MVTKQAKVTGEGQITIPTEVREALGLREGDMIAFEVDDQDYARLRAVRGGSPFARYAGALREDRELGAKVVVEELRKARGW